MFFSLATESEAARASSELKQSRNVPVKERVFKARPPARRDTSCSAWVKRLGRLYGFALIQQNEVNEPAAIKPPIDVVSYD